MGKNKSVLKAETTHKTPKLWSPENPTLYYAKTALSVDFAVVDEYETHFGFRTFYADANKGFFINDKHYKIYGMCSHADSGLFGKAVPDNIHRYKVNLIKQMGAWKKCYFQRPFVVFTVRQSSIKPMVFPFMLDLVRSLLI